MANTQDQSDLIWIEEAKIVYKHSRAWFERRIDLGIFEMVQLVGSTRKYLKRSQVEQYVRSHAEEDGQ
jgi:hypothetical protein